MVQDSLLATPAAYKENFEMAQLDMTEYLSVKRNIYLESIFFGGLSWLSLCGLTKVAGK